MERMSEVKINQLKPLIDGDILVYRAGFAADAEARSKGFADEDYEREAIGNVKSVLNKLIDKFHPDYRLFLSGSGNFREHVATIKPYKGNRPETAKPKYYKQIKDYMVNHWNAEVVHGREADDALGTAQWAAKDLSTIIVSIDKDLDMVPGHHYNWVKDEFYFVPLREANLRIFYQMLEGDVTDNIPGIKGVGPKTIARIWEDCGHELERIREAVQGEYRRQYGTEWRQAYEEVAKLLWIERVEGKECPFLWS